MKKMIWLMMVAMGMIAICCRSVNAQNTTDDANGTLESGMMLDCARRYYTVEEIERYIDALSQNKNAFLQLHLTDNENVGIECRTLGQTTDDAQQTEDGVYINPDTQKAFLSYEQIQDIMNYANEKGVTFIPEIEMPGHMSAFFELARLERGEEYFNQIAVNQEEVPGELNISTFEGLLLAKELLIEYSQLFAGCQYFHMGCDEYWTNWGDRMVAFINSQASYLQGKGFVVRIWNDMLNVENVEKLNHKMQIVYWSYDGAASTEELRQERIKNRLSVPELQEKGFEIILTNCYYLYFVPSEADLDEALRVHKVANIRENWDLTKWDSKYEGGLTTYENIMGAMLTVWGEESAGVSDELIRNQAVDMYTAMVEKMVVKEEEKESDSENTTETSENTSEDNVEQTTEVTTEHSTETATEERIEHSTEIVTEAGKESSTETTTEEKKQSNGNNIQSKPKKVTGLKKKKAYSKKVTLVWKKQKNITKYIVYKYNKKTKKYCIYKTTKKNYITVKGLTPNTVYKFKVRAYKKVDKKIHYGKYSKVLKVKTKR